MRHINPRGTQIRKFGEAKFKFGQLILRKIIKIVVTDVIFKAKMHQIRFRLGLCPDPAGRARSAPPDLLAGFKGSYF